MKLQSTVKFWNSERGFGFIHNGYSRDIMVHYTQLLNAKALSPNDKVEFEIEVSTKGLVAKSVQLISEGDNQTALRTSGNANTQNRPHQINFRSQYRTRTY